MLGLGDIPWWKQEDEDQRGKGQKEAAPRPSYNWRAVRLAASFPIDPTVKDNEVLFAPYLMLKECVAESILVTTQYLAWELSGLPEYSTSY